jgi:hypothetical protein
VSLNTQRANNKLSSLKENHFGSVCLVIITQCSVTHKNGGFFSKKNGRPIYSIHDVIIYVSYIFLKSLMWWCVTTRQHASDDVTFFIFQNSFFPLKKGSNFPPGKRKTNNIPVRNVHLNVLSFVSAAC